MHSASISGFHHKLQRLSANRGFEWFVIAVIILSAVVVGARIWKVDSTARNCNAMYGSVAQRHKPVASAPSTAL